MKILRSQLFMLLVVLSVLGFALYSQSSSPEVEEIGFPKFMELAEQGAVKELTISGQQFTGTLDDGASFHTVGPLFHEASVYPTLVEYGIVPSYEPMEDASMLVTIGVNVVMMLVVVGLFMWFMRNLQSSNGRAMQFGKSRAKLQTEGGRRYTFEDVAGVEESKEELSEVVEFLREPRKFTRLGGRIPKGVLLMGSPGTGKTLLARAVAGEAGVPFFSISGSDFVEMFVGVGASRVRDLFEQAKQQAPCIIFIDEIDAVGRHRGAGVGGGHDEREQTLNQLLVEMDGFDGTEGVIVVAATNRADVLDPALLRPGRFDRRVMVPNPDVRGREAILKIHTRRMPLGDRVDLATVSKVTPGFSGADLENLCNEAALIAARHNKAQVDAEDFEYAREKIFMGPERRSLIMPEKEKRDTAYHEAGHAIIAHLLPDYDPVHKVTIVPRGRALGLTWTMPNEDRLSTTRTMLLKRIAMLMGGRAAEEVALNMLSAGAKNDLERATEMARSMVCELGMSDKLGPVTYGKGAGEPFMGREMGRQATYSEHTAQEIDQEVRSILITAYRSAVEVLTSNIHVLHRVAQTLIERESLNAEEFTRLVEEAGPVPPGDLGWLGA